MSTLFFMIVLFVVVIHFLGIFWLAYAAWKPLKCLCGNRFKMPKVGDYICPRCESVHAPSI